MLLSTDRSSIDITPEGPGLSVLFCTPLIRRDTGVVSPLNWRWRRRSRGGPDASAPAHHPEV